MAWYSRIWILVLARRHLGINCARWTANLLQTLGGAWATNENGQISRSFRVRCLWTGFTSQTVKSCCSWDQLFGIIVQGIRYGSSLSSLVSIVWGLTCSQRYLRLRCWATLKQPDLLYLESPISLLSHDGVGLYLKALDYPSLSPDLLITATS